MTKPFEVGYDIPAAIGMAEAEIMTPALVLDRDVFEANVAAMASSCRALGIDVRPHGKAHKTPKLALRQMEHGAVGICCQKVSEAEAFVRGGITDVLVANEVSDPQKIDRLARLAGRASVAVCADDPAGVLDLSRAAVAHGIRLRVLVEVDVGAGRCGVCPGEEAAAIAKAISDADGLTFGGVQAYNGSNQHIASAAERASAVKDVVAATSATVAAIKNAGLACETVTGAGTGTYSMEGGSAVYTEVQPGSYAFMDASYGRIEPPAGEPRMRSALFVLTQIMSTAVPGQAVCDAGLKALAMDDRGPQIVGDGVSYVSPSDEHGTIADPQNILRRNDKLRLIPGHCDPTCNLYDHMVVVSGGRVVDLWPISARGKGF